jgi:membrane protein DedA with SNARE-associated domain
VTSFIAAHGVYAIFLLMAVDAILPAASELVMLVGGALATGAFADQVTLFGATLSKGATTFLAVALAGTLGYFAGSLLGWAIGRYGGRPLLERHRRWFHLKSEQLDRAERWFDRWGAIGVLVGRVTPLVRSFVSIAAGVFEMPLGIYIVLTLVGSAVWAFALAGAGWAAGTGYATIHHDWRYVEVTVGLCVLVGLAYALRRRTAARA